MSTGSPVACTRPLRVAVLDHTAVLGGAELALARLAAAIDPGDVELHVVTFSPGPLVERVRQAGHAAEVVPLPGTMAGLDRRSAGRLGTAVRSALRLGPFAWRLARRLRELDVDLVHTTSLKADLIGVPVAALSRRPLVWHVHDRIAPDYLPGSMVRLLRAIARRVPAHVIANSTATAATLPGVRRLTVAHPGLAPDQLAAAPRGPLAAQSPVVGVLGRISPTKAQLDFVRAAAIVAADHPDVRFRIVGAATFGAEDYERQVRDEVGLLGLADRVELTGFVDDPTSELEAMAVCVHTASVPEPFGQVVVEAMGRGVPVVATSGGGVDEILVPGEDGQALGWLAPAGDVAALAAAITRALDDPDEAADRARRAWERAATRFTVQRTAETITAVWQSVASGPSRRSPGSAVESGPRTPRPRVAIAHDYLTQRGGAERVVLAILRAFPDATIHTTLYDPDGTFPEFRQARIVTSPLNRVGLLRRHHRAALPLLPYAVSRLRVDADVLVASSSGWAHGIRTTGRKLVYCHAPARWLYQAETYLGGATSGSAKGRALAVLTPWLRRWDQRAAASADRYLVNSNVVRGHVRAAYGLDADVLAPPFGLRAGDPQEPHPDLVDWADEGYHLIVSRLLPYKNVGPAIEAFRGLPERLVVVGHGPLEEQLRRTLPANARIVTGPSDAQLRWIYAHATALVAPSIEDFGLTPLEAAAFGRPTLALRAGGYLDTVAPGLSGAFFEEPSPEAIRGAVEAARGQVWDADAIRAHADAFSEERFRDRLRDEVRCLTSGD